MPRCSRWKRLLRAKFRARSMQMFEIRLKYNNIGATLDEASINIYSKLTRANSLDPISKYNGS